MSHPAVEDRFLHLPEVLSSTGLGKTKLYELIRNGRFPAPIKIDTASRWCEKEIAEWKNQCKASRE